MLKIFRYLFPLQRKEAVIYNKEINKKLNNLSKKIGIKFRNKNYYLEAITHRSFLHIHNNKYQLNSNERLEFLGDSVLNLIVSEFIYKKFKESSEGNLTKIRSQFVNRDTLNEVGQKIKIIDNLLLSENAHFAMDRGAKSIVSDAVEALIGAIFLDHGMRSAREFVQKNIIDKYINELNKLIERNYKSRLLEYAQGEKIGQISYKIKRESGPEHNREFEVDIYINDEIFGSGSGKTKKQAEQEAAFSALKKLNIL